MENCWLGCFVLASLPSLHIEAKLCEQAPTHLGGHVNEMRMPGELSFHGLARTLTEKIPQGPLWHVTILMSIWIYIHDSQTLHSYDTSVARPILMHKLCAADQ